jgi:hypothetical protein
MAMMDTGALKGRNAIEEVGFEGRVLCSLHLFLNVLFLSTKEVFN